MHVLLHVQPEREDQVHDDRRGRRDERGVDEKQTDVARGNAHAFTQVGAHAEGMLFHKKLEPLHRWSVHPNLLILNDSMAYGAVQTAPQVAIICFQLQHRLAFQRVLRF